MSFPASLPEGPDIPQSPLGPVITDERKPQTIIEALKREYIAGGTDLLLMALRKVLPQYIDDVERDLGTDTYEKMLQDPIVWSAFNTRVLQVLADGMRVVR